MPRRSRINTLEDLLAEAKQLRRKQVMAVAVAEDDAVLEGIGDALRAGIVSPVLIGDAPQIRRLARSMRISLKNVELVNEPDPAAAVLTAVKMCREGTAQMLMKGKVQTAVVLKAVLDRERGLSTDRILSLVALFHSPRVGRLLLLSDPGVNVHPDLARKIEIIRNMVYVAECLGMTRPKVAVLAAVETIKPEMPSTTDAAILTQMNLNGQLRGAVVAGPYALDLALSPHAAREKNIHGPVAGKANLLVAPDIEAGNILYKSLIHCAGLESALMVVGARVPLVITSRSDSGPTKLNSIALAVVVANRGGTLEP